MKAAQARDSQLALAILYRAEGRQPREGTMNNGMDDLDIEGEERPPMLAKVANEVCSLMSSQDFPIKRGVSPVVGNSLVWSLCTATSAWE